MNNKNNEKISLKTVMKEYGINTNYLSSLSYIPIDRLKIITENQNEMSSIEAFKLSVALEIPFTMLYNGTRQWNTRL